MDKTIVTALLVIAGVISAVALFNALYPMVTQGGEAMGSMERRLSDQLKTQVQIIHAAKSGSNTVTVWAKNVGSVRIIGADTSDLFFGPEGNFERIAYGGSGAPRWEYTVENATEWTPTATIKITITTASALPASPSGRYFVKLTLPNGVMHDYFFSW